MCPARLSYPVHSGISTLCGSMRKKEQPLPRLFLDYGVLLPLQKEQMENFWGSERWFRSYLHRFDTRQARNVAAPGRFCDEMAPLSYNQHVTATLAMLPHGIQPITSSRFLED